MTPKARLITQLDHGDLTFDDWIDLVAERANLSPTGQALTLAPIPGSAPTDPYVYPVVSGNLDASAGDEVVIAMQPTSLTESEQVLEPNELVIRGGPTFEELWRVRTWGGVIGVADLVGDPAAELVSIEFFNGTVGFISYAGPVVQRVRVRDGRTGAIIWEQQTVAAISIIDTFFSSPGARADVFQDLISAVYLVPDADGDGKADLFVQRDGYRKARGSVQVAAGFAYQVDVHADVIAGGDGRTVSRTTARAVRVGVCDSASCLAVGGYPSITPSAVPGVGGGPDLAIVDFSTGRGTLRLASHSGVSRWTQPISEAVVDAYPLELDGQPGLEVARNTWDSTLYEQVLSIHGREGYLDWHSRAHGELWAWYPIGDVDGDSGWDIYMVVDSDITVASGRNGSRVWRRGIDIEYPDEHYSRTESICPCGDINMDSVTDIVVFARLWSEDAALPARAAVLDGRSGSQLWLSEPLPPNADAFILDHDLDQDGSRELIAGADVGSHLKADVVSGTNGAIKWSSALPLDTREWPDYYDVGFLPVASNIDGDDSGEIAIGLFEAGRSTAGEEVERLSDIRAFLVGADGIRWQS